MSEEAPYRIQCTECSRIYESSLGRCPRCGNVHARVILSSSESPLADSTDTHDLKERLAAILEELRGILNLMKDEDKES